MVTQSAMGGLALILGILALTGSVQIWHVYLLAFLLGMVTLVVPDASGLRCRDGGPQRHGKRDRAEQCRLDLARIAGPAVAGLVISTLGTAGGLSRECGVLRRCTDRARAHATC